MEQGEQVMDIFDKLIVTILVITSCVVCACITVPQIQKLNNKVIVLETKLNHFVLDTNIYPTDCGQDTVVTIEYR